MLCNNVSAKFIFYFVLTFDSWSFFIKKERKIFLSLKVVSEMLYTLGNFFIYFFLYSPVTIFRTTDIFDDVFIGQLFQISLLYLQMSHINNHINPHSSFFLPFLFHYPTLLQMLYPWHTDFSSNTLAIFSKKLHLFLNFSVSL